MRKILLGDTLITIYEENLLNEYLPIMQYGENKVSTYELKESLNKVIGCIEQYMKICMITDEKFERYNTALTVLKSTRLIFNRRGNSNSYPSKSDVKVAMDVVAEIGIASETNPDIKQAIKVTNFFAQAMMNF